MAEWSLKWKAKGLCGSYLDENLWWQRQNQTWWQKDIILYLLHSCVHPSLQLVMVSEHGHSAVVGWVWSTTGGVVDEPHLDTVKMYPCLCTCRPETVVLGLTWTYMVGSARPLAALALLSVVWSRTIIAFRGLGSSLSPRLQGLTSSLSPTPHPPLRVKKPFLWAGKSPSVLLASPRHSACYFSIPFSLHYKSKFFYEFTLCENLGNCCFGLCYGPL